MKQDRQRVFPFWIVLLCCISGIIVLFGCSAGQSAGVEQTYCIAVIGAQDYVFSDDGFVRGMELAFTQEGGEGEHFQWEYYDDQSDYEQGLMLAQQLAEDQEVVAVISFQDFEIIDAQMPYFEEAKKPFFAATGCYETTLEKGYQYLFSVYVSPEDMGAVMADYCAKLGCTKVACAHTSTVYETEEVLGFSRRAAEIGISIVDMTQELNSQTDLKVTWQKWRQLGVDGLYTCRYIDNMQEKEWLFQTIQYFRQQQQDFVILGDYSLKLPDSLKEYRVWLDGIAFPEPYPAGGTGAQASFQRTYQDYYETETVPAGAYQGYDLVQMLAAYLLKGSDSGGIAAWLRMKTGYEGVSGTIYYDEAGKLSLVNSQEKITVYQTETTG